MVRMSPKHIIHIFLSELRTCEAIAGAALEQHQPGYSSIIPRQSILGEELHMPHFTLNP
jgi:hypothetical protein